MPIPLLPFVRKKTADPELPRNLSRAEELLIKTSRIHAIYVISGHADGSALADVFARVRLRTVHDAWIRVFRTVVAEATVPVYVRPPGDVLRSLHEKMLVLAIYALRSGNEVGYLRALERVVPRRVAVRLRPDLEMVASNLETVLERWPDAEPLALAGTEPVGPLVLH